MLRKCYTLPQLKSLQCNNNIFKVIKLQIIYKLCTQCIGTKILLSY